MRSRLGCWLVCAVAGAGCSAELGSGLGEDNAQAIASHNSSDPFGTASTSSATKIDLGAKNPFFESFGTNGRTCGTCHDADQGWTLTPSALVGKVASDPLFVFDGSDCLAPGVANSNPTANSTAMLSRALVRIEIPILSTADYTLTAFTDPFHCPSSPLSTGVLRMYRRPLPTSSTALLATIMWDGREPSLSHQADDATLGHAQALQPLTSANNASIVSFETGIFHAQKQVVSGATTANLAANGANGGSDYLLNTIAPGFFIGINDVFSKSFTPIAFTIYKAWEPGGTPPNTLAASIGRGEVLFNTKPISITGVAGLNGPNDASQAPIAGTCTTCHDTPNVGNHSVSLAIDIGVTGVAPPNLDVAHLPTYTFQQNVTGQTITVTDPGRGLITGHFKDIGKTKGPVLRGLSARAPYFHNGSAGDFGTVVDFYNARFGIGFSGQERADLIAFLSAL